MKSFYTTEVGFKLVWALLFVLFYGLVVNFIVKAFTINVSDLLVVAVTAIAAVASSYWLWNNHNKKPKGKKK